MTPKEIALHRIRPNTIHQHRCLESSWMMTTEDAGMIDGNRRYEIIRSAKKPMRLVSSMLFDSPEKLMSAAGHELLSFL